MTSSTSSAWHDLADDASVLPEPAVGLVDAPPADLLVVGLGASGLEAVVAAALRGARVVGVDAVGVAAGAAGANGGLLLAGLARFHHDAVAAHGRDVALTWYRTTLAELDRLADDEPTLRRVGSLRTAVDDAEMDDLRAHVDALAADGLPGGLVEVDGRPALLVPGDGVVQPAARCQRLARAALAAGARLVAPARVTAVVPDGVAVEGLDRPVAAHRVLVAVDGGLERIVPGLAARVRTVRLQMLATAPDPGVALPVPRYHRYGLDWVQQLADGRVLLGGGRDVGGRAEHDAPAEPSGPVQAHLDAWCASLGVTAPVTHRWGARVAYTDDRLPLDQPLGPSAHVVGAYSGHGNVLGGLLARRAALRLLHRG